MKVISNFSKNYDEDPIRFFNFEKYENQSKDVDFFIGSHPDDSIFNESKNKKIFFSTEEQTWNLDSTDRYLNQVEKILTICPPKITNRLKRESVIYNKSSVYQDRNVQDLVTNLENEIIGYRNTFNLINDIENYLNYLPEKTKKYIQSYRNCFNP